jgi:non-lysosomal glucosylceramidase
LTNRARAKAPNPSAIPRSIQAGGEGFSSGARAVSSRPLSAHHQKPWNGEYFRYDTESEYKDNIQADQLAGQWYADLTGLGDLVPREMQISSLKKIVDYNVMKFADANRPR